MITSGEVDQHTIEYQAKLKKLNIVLPSIAFHKDTPNFVVDITELPMEILKDYGFIPEKKTLEQIAVEALLELSENKSPVKAEKKAPIAAKKAPKKAAHLH